VFLLFFFGFPLFLSPSLTKKWNPL
jgi:hypothetical protein